MSYRTQVVRQNITYLPLIKLYQIELAMLLSTSRGSLEIWEPFWVDEIFFMVRDHADLPRTQNMDNGRE